MRRWTQALFGAFLGCLALGLYAWVGTVDWPAYFPALQGHLALGIALILGSSPALAYHLRQTGSRLVPSLLIPAAALAVLWLVCPGRPEYPAFGPIGWAAGTSCIQLLVTAGFMAAMKHPGHSVKTSTTGVILAVTTLYALHVGVFGWLLRGDERWGPMLAHSAIGIAAGALLLPHLKVFRTRPPLLVGTGTVGLLALLGAIWFPTYPHDLVLDDFRSPLDLGDTPLLEAAYRDYGTRVRQLPMNAAERRMPVPEPMDAAVIANSRSCGASGCHENITKQFEGSAHRHAADNALYLAAVKQFVTENGPEDAAFCANCHDPVSVLAGTVVQDYADGSPPPSDGVSCVVCHSTVHVDPKANNGVFTVREPPTYPGGTEEARNRNIRLDPRRHRQALVANFRLNDPSGNCKACHRVLLSPDIGAATTALVQAASEDAQLTSDLDCTDCHMPTLTTNRSFEQPVYDHYMSGVNLDLPRYATGGDPEALAFVAQHTRAFMSGEVDTSAFGAADLAYGIPDATVEVMAGRGVLALELAPTVGSEGLQVAVTSTNHRAGHPFPIGPFDLQEIWQTLRVTDADGAVLFDGGALDEQGRVPPEAPRLGALELGRDGKPLQRHRIWDLAKIVGKRQIGQGLSTDDAWAVPLPADPAWPLTVRATWKLRRANPEFTTWAMGADAELFPAHEIAAAEVSVPGP
jgi:hypothetical protein